MTVQQTIAIIGADSEYGFAIAKNLPACFRLLLLARDDQHIQKLNVELQTNPIAGAEIMNCAVDASWEADIIIIAISRKEQEDVAGRIKDVAVGKIVINLEKGNDIQPEAPQVMNLLLPCSKVVTVSFTNNGSEVAKEVLISGSDDDAVLFTHSIFNL